MAVGAFPLIKLGALALRQIAKPLANFIKNRAKNSQFFRTYVCMPPAQMYNYFEVNVKMKVLGLGKPTNVKKLNETAAIELGAELLGESIIFFVAVLTLAAEYNRQSKKSALENQIVEERWGSTEKRIAELEFLTEKQRVEIKELTRLIYSNQTSNKITKPNNDSNDSNKSPKAPSNSPLSGAIDESIQKLNSK